jgi:DNA-binding transcriptional ArsR family regulator
MAERAAAYETASCILATSLRLQTALSLRPEELQVYLVVVLATVQRFMREPDPDPVLLTRAVLPPELSGETSRRRIADVTGIPLETVRRHVARLMGRGLVIERGRGRLCTPGGTLARMAAQDLPVAVAEELAALVTSLLRRGVFRILD